MRWHCTMAPVQTECAALPPETEREALARQLQHAVKSCLGVSARVRVSNTGFVERTLTGKARRVIDKRPRAMVRNSLAAG